MTFTQFLRVWPVKSRLDQRLRQYSKRNKFIRIGSSVRSMYLRFRPILRTKTINEIQVGSHTTYSMEAWMVISRDALKAMDHVRWAGAIRDFAPCGLGREEGAVREPIMNRSVVAIRLWKRASYRGITAKKRWRPRDTPESVKVITRNELCWYIPGFHAKQGTAQLFTLCVCRGPGPVLVLIISSFGPRDMRESQVRFGKCDNNRN